jgi:hypothetical protein
MSPLERNLNLIYIALLLAEIALGVRQLQKKEN